MSHPVEVSNLITPEAVGTAFAAMKAAEVALGDAHASYRAAKYISRTDERIVRPFLDKASAEYEASVAAYTALADAFAAQGKAYLQQDVITIHTAEEWDVIDYYRGVFNADVSSMYAEHGWTEAVAAKSRDLNKFLSALKRWSAAQVEELDRMIRATDKLVDTTDRFLDTLRGSYREDEIADFKPFLVTAIRASKRNTMLTRDEHLKAINAAYTALEAKLNESVAA